MKLPLFLARLPLFANDRTDAAEVGFANQLAANTIPEWVEIPFGNHDHKNGLQVFDRDSAAGIVREFNALVGARTFGGLPWYVGHPDVPEFANVYKDRSARGWVKEMEVGDNGLRLRVKWNSAGEGIIANEEFKYFSPVWRVEPVAGKSRQFRPVRMKSIGFTNEPNIGVLPLSNANEHQPTNDMNLKELATLLGLDPETATPESILAAIAALKEAASAAPAAVANEKAAREQAELQLANEKAAREQADAALAAEKAEAQKAAADFANERKARVDLLLAGAIREGRITEAQRDTWANELTTTFEEKSAALAALKPSVHTQAHTKNLGQRKEVSNAAQKVIELANERMAANEDGNWNRAWKETLQAHPDLATLMNTKPANA